MPLGSFGVDLDAVRTFVAVTEAGQFSEAAADLSLTQQAVSKRVAALETDLGVRLLTRTAHGLRSPPCVASWMPGQPARPQAPSDHRERNL